MISLKMIFYYLFIFVLGISIGSFLNVLIYRIESPNYRSSTSIVGGRSYCPHCRHQIRFYDNIPILSFLILRGKCRDCKGRISAQYPLVEIGVGILFIIGYFLASKLRITNYELRSECFSFDFLNVSCFIFHVSWIYLLIVFSGLIAIFVYDFKHYIIPNKIIYPLIALVVVFNLFQVSSFQSWQEIMLSLLVPLFFLLLIIVSRGAWMGMGDVKLAIFMALLIAIGALPDQRNALFEWFKK